MRRIKGLGMLFFAASMVACGANENILKSGKATPQAVDSASSKSPVEKELDAMRTAGFQFIFVLKRKDGGKIDAEDRGIIKLRSADANRRVATDDGLAILIGTNTQLTPENMKALYDRFAVDSYSQPNGNSNTNK
jgi:hypothetical protein